ncbi:MAG: hypothetical protein J5680_02875 [Neisseriaceae bacterium]|nr:hypothetical protein [Neisseriaceae bacterium]
MGNLLPTLKRRRVGILAHRNGRILFSGSLKALTATPLALWWARMPTLLALFLIFA